MRVGAPDGGMPPDAVEPLVTVPAGPFLAGLGAHGDRPAVVAAGGARLGYRELDRRVDELADRLGARRRLVLLAAANDLDSLVGYLAALRGRHPVLVTARDRPAHLRSLVERYDPDVVLDGAGRSGRPQPQQRRPGTRHELHPELALLLSTSGSTGAPKLVRLSAAGLAANAAAIAGYLGIRDTDRAAVSVPMHHCYGLSVVNSNLLRGAALLLSDDSVTDPGFWSRMLAERGTSIHGVPYTFELLDRVGFADMGLPALRYLTQAGGRLPPSVVRRYAELGARRGWRLFVMYGQTEATARMAYLPPELAATSPSTIGVPIPGGTFEIERAGRSPVGELVFRGPSVMLGYAHGPGDLAAGRRVHALRTGDLARVRPDGLYEIVGRRERFIKPFGLRIDLGRVEQLLADEHCPAVCTGSDDELVVAVGGDADPRRVRAVLADRLALPEHVVRVVVVARLPRLPNGKPDRGAVVRMCRRHLPARPGGGRAGRSGRRLRGVRLAGARPGSVREAFGSVFGPGDLSDDATFVGLGGDSLSYVRMSVALERVLGHLPDGWQQMSLAELEGLPRRHRAWSATETGVLLRAVAIVLVVGSHAGLFHLLGGAHVLLGVAGWAFARFVLPAPDSGPVALSGRILRGAARIAVPSMLWIGWRAGVEDDVRLVDVLLVNAYADPATWGYWFVEVLSQLLVLLALLFAIPGVRRFERARPFGFALLVLAAGLAARILPVPGNEFADRLMSTHLVAWLFALGWVGYRARTGGQRFLVAGLVLALVPGFFDEAGRGLLATAGLLLLLLIPRLPVPRVAVGVVGAVAGASLTIYLTHYAVLQALAGLPALLVVAVAVGGGVVLQSALTVVSGRISRLRTARRHRGGAGPLRRPAAGSPAPCAATSAAPAAASRAPAAAG